MSYTPVAVDEFHGMDLRADPETLGLSAATYAHNVTLINRGRVKVRPGYSVYAGLISGVRRGVMKRFGPVVAMASEFQYDGVHSAVQFVDAETGADHGNDLFWAADFAACGPTGTIYRCNTSGGLRAYEPTTHTGSGVLADTPAGSLLATTPRSDRLAIAGQADTAAVGFSKVGDGTVWAANDYVRLHPGDGEPIMALCAHGDELYAFKQSKFFIFTGESTDGTGKPIFNFRAVEMGKGCAYVRAAVSTPYGVFFVGRDGVYVTNGDAPELVSDAISPVFQAGLVSNWSLVHDTTDGAWITYHENRLVVTLASGLIFVYDLLTQDWVVWQTATQFGVCLGDVPAPDGGTQLLLAHQGGILRQLGTEATDNGTAVTGTYRSGLSNLGYPGKKVIREVMAFGLSPGATTVSLVDEAGTLASDTIAIPGRLRKAAEAERFGWQVSGNEWVLQSLTLHARDQRAMGDS